MLKDNLSIVCEKRHIRRTGVIALVVGTWLTAFNHGDAIVAGALTASLAMKIFLNYLTPFVVANFGLLSRHK